MTSVRVPFRSTALPQHGARTEGSALLNRRLMTVESGLGDMRLPMSGWPL